MDDARFGEMEVDFQRVVKMLSDDPKLASFKIEYEKLHAALEESHDGEKRLMAKCTWRIFLLEIVTCKLTREVILSYISCCISTCISHILF